MIQIARSAKKAAHALAKSTLEERNAALKILAEKLHKYQGAILEANQKDRELAKLNPALLERLSLENRLDAIIHDVEQVIKLPDPLGEVREARTLPNRLQLSRVSTPIGVIGVIYESRPNVTIDISALAIKSGNAVLLRGGSETVHTNQVLVRLIQESLEIKDAVQLILHRTDMQELLKLHQYIDLIIPRGSAALQQFCREHSTIPVITGGVGICHLFVDETADQERSLEVIWNAKTQRCTVCNALNTLLVHERIATDFIPKVKERLKEVTFNTHEFDTEWLSLILSIKVVTGLDEAIAHIQTHGTAHSDGILTEDPAHAERFVREVDSAAVYVNASTRFTDGAEFGMGGEVAVSTGKLHARGPMGLESLTSYKWVARGHYHTRS